MGELQELEKELYELTKKVHLLRAETKPTPVENYRFKDQSGEVSLLDLFGEKETLFLIHNMGQGCRYCTLWADGFNGFVPHLESQFSFAVVSKDTPEVQRRFANARQWRFKMASHLGTDYMLKESVMPGEKNMPGIVCYIREGKSLFKKNSSVFGPGDEYCSLWNMLSLAGYSAENWTPQFDYWKRPESLDDGGKNLL